MGENRSQTLHYVEPGWLLFDSGTSVEAMDFLQGGSFVADRRLRDAILGHETNSILSALSIFDTTLARLRDDLLQSSPRVLDRAALLRGTGFDTLFLELGSHCNERCIHCYANSGPLRNDELSWSVVRSVLDDASALGFRLVQFTGGDPLSSGLLLPSVRHATSLDISVLEIFTNGLALQGALYQELLRYSVRFALSIYAHDAAIHDAITRTPGSHAGTVDALRRLISDGVPTRVSVVAMAENASVLADTVEFLEAMGIQKQFIAVDVSRAVGRGVKTELVDDLLPAAREPADDGHSRPTFVGKVAVSYDGQVYPCIFARHVSLGSVAKSRLRDIVALPAPIVVEPKRLRETLRKGSERLTCRDCQLRVALLGGSPCPTV